MSTPILPIHWDVRAGVSDGDPDWEATASFDEFVLVAVEMREAFLTGKPGFLPRVSWCLSHCPGSGDIQVGGPAPTLEDAKARAEVALRVWIGAAMDS